VSSLQTVQRPSEKNPRRVQRHLDEADGPQPRRLQLRRTTQVLRYGVHVVSSPTRTFQRPLDPPGHERGRFWARHQTRTSQYEEVPLLPPRGDALATQRTPLLQYRPVHGQNPRLDEALHEERAHGYGRSTPRTFTSDLLSLSALFTQRCGRSGQVRSSGVSPSGLRWFGRSYPYSARYVGYRWGSNGLTLGFRKSQRGTAQERRLFRLGGQADS
jgi:hypothetical protein